MDHQRQPGFPCGRDMLAEPGDLRLARAGVAEIVEPCLADRHDLRMLCDRDERLCIDLRLFVRMVGMCADRAEDFQKSVGDRQDLRWRLTRVEIVTRRPMPAALARP